MKNISLNPTLWRTCRILANDLRLDMLRYLVTERSVNVENVAFHFEISDSLASQYLRALGARGLLTAEKTFRYVFYRPEPNATIPETKYILAAMENAFIKESRSNKEIIHTLTGFTHPRRLKIIKQLATGKKDFHDLKYSTAISRPALRRHLAKLLDRNIVAMRRDMDTTVYEIAKLDDSLANTLVFITINF